jgi:hypothetical protein
MKRILVTGFAFVLLLLELESPVFAGLFDDYNNHDRLIDFGIFYPIVKIKKSEGAEKRQQGSAGFRFQYQFYLTDNLGIVLTPNAWFFRLRVDGQNATLVLASLETGACLRILPDSYLDPTLSVSGGLSVTDAGKALSLGLAYPGNAELGINLWRQQSRFQDPSLAFHVFGGSKYYFNAPKLMNPLMYHAGIAFRGSF